MVGELHENAGELAHESDALFISVAVVAQVAATTGELNELRGINE